MHYPRIRDLREDMDRTQQEIADILGCNVTVYRRYENGVWEAPAWLLVELAKIYNVSIDYIVGLTNK